jgi:SanA protein
MKKIIKNLMQIIIIAAALALIAAYAINSYVVDSSSQQLLTLKDASESDEKSDCILILGCGVRSDGTPSDMLEDRLKTGISLYKAGAAPKIIMSGDHGSQNYDEVNVMKQYAIDSGIPSEDIFMDHAGFSTYESIYRAKEIFDVKSAVIVTQKFHIFRALYIANAFGIKASGVSSDLRSYRGQRYVELREMLARNKDFLTCIIKPKPTYLGETIPVSGSGDLTND